MTTNKPDDQPTAQELSVLKKHLAERDTAPRIKLLKNGNTTEISVDHPSQSVGLVLLMQALGTADTDFVNGLLLQLDYARDDEAGINFLLSVIKGVKPKDQLEAMLAAQMAVTHNLTMTFARKLNDVQNIRQQESAERAFNKVARTYTTQMEALKRYRTDRGDQKVLVQQVSVSEGGQAIVGNITQAARETAPDKAATSPPALTDARMAAMPIIGNQEPTPVALLRGEKDESST